MRQTLYYNLSINQARPPHTPCSAEYWANITTIYLARQKTAFWKYYNFLEFSTLSHIKTENKGYAFKSKYEHRKMHNAHIYIACAKLRIRIKQIIHVYSYSTVTEFPTMKHHSLKLTWISSLIFEIICGIIRQLETIIKTQLLNIPFSKLSEILRIWFRLLFISQLCSTL